MTEDTASNSDEIHNQKMACLKGIRAGAVVRPEPLYHRRTRLIIDTHHNSAHNILCNGVEEIEFQNLQLFSLDKLFDNKREVFLGFGTPNVYLTIPNEKFDGYVKFAAFIFWRQQSAIIDTKGRVQSGFLIRFRDCSDELIDTLRKSMQLNSNQRHISCAYANACVLYSASITSDGGDLRSYYSARSLFQRIYQSGLEFRGEPITLDFIRITPRTLEEHLHEVSKKQYTSVGRTLKKVAGECWSPDDKHRAPLLTAENIPMKPIVSSDESSLARLEISHPRLFGALLRKLFGSHTLFRITPTSETINIDEFLPETLRAFPSPNPDFFTRIKKSFLFSRPVVTMIRKQLAAIWDNHGEFSVGPLASMMSIHTRKDPHPYNMVITGSYIIGMHSHPLLNMKLADWILSKHVLISGYDDDVRFAGEVWMEHKEDGLHLHLTNNSGTYKPSDEQLAEAGRFVSKILPGLRVELHSTKDPSPLETNASEDDQNIFSCGNIFIILLTIAFWIIFALNGLQSVFYSD